MSRKAEHVAEESLVDIASGRPPRAAERAHLDRCPACAGRGEELERLVEDMRSDRAAGPGEAVVHRAVALFPERPALARRLLETVARLVRGSEELALAAAAGVRGESSGPARLQFAGDDDVQVDLELLPAPEASALRVTGQVFGFAGGELPVLVWAESGQEPRAALTAAAVSDQGMFLFEALPADRFDLVLDLGRRRLRLPVRPELG